MSTYPIQLKTGWPDGRRVSAVVAQHKTTVQVCTRAEFDFLESCPENDFGLRFVNGRFVFECEYTDYAANIIKLTKFLEDVVFAAMVEAEKQEQTGGVDANKNSGDHGDTKRKRNKKRNSATDHGEDNGDKSSSIFPGIFDRARGREQTEGLGQSDASPDEVAPRGDSVDREID